MNTDPRLPELFEQAAALAGAERAGWLAALGRAEPELAREVAELLAAAGDERLDVPAWRKLAFDAESESTAPRRVGPYDVVREIGRGGMGRVYLAEHEIEGIRRRVALKLLDRPAASEREMRRFREEVRILAALEHPGIARFLDGGRTGDGVSFLVLEYVDGVDLVEHARRAGLDLPAKIRTFLAVLAAVDYAHRQGVVHRDLKPSNILVGDDGRPRLLDFGIARLLKPEPSAANAAATTRTDERVLTPAYASPEQFRGDPVTIASDVYSLGVILYELLAGRRPFDDGTTGAAEIARAVLESDPEPPSTATAPRSSPQLSSGARPRRRFGRDLDAICLRALRRDGGERYASAAAFADDLERYLDGRPVAALRGDRFHRVVRLLRRRRRPLLVAAALAVAALAFALALTRRPLARDPAPRPFPLPARDERPVAEIERRFVADPTDLLAGAALVSAQVRAGEIDAAAATVAQLRRLPGGTTDPLVDYFDSVVATNRDEPQRALALLAVALERAIAGGRGELVARIRSARGRVLSDLGRREEAFAELEAARLGATGSGDDETLARVLNDLGIEAMSRGDFAEGERRLEEALAAAGRAGDAVRAGAVGHNLGGIAAMRGRWADAERRFREAASTFRALDSTRRVGISLGDLGNALRELGRPAEAKPVLEEAIAILRTAGDDTSLVYALSYRAELELAAGLAAEAEAAAEEIAALAEASGNRAGLGLADRLRGLAAAASGDALTAWQRLGRAERILSENGEADLATMVALERARLELETGMPTAALARAERARANVDAGGESDLDFEATLVAATAAIRSGRPDEGRRLLESLGPDAASRDSVRLRIVYLRANAELAEAAGDRAWAVRHLAAAVRLAQTSGRLLDARSATSALDQLGGAPNQGAVSDQ